MHWKVNYSLYTHTHTHTPPSIPHRILERNKQTFMTKKQQQSGLVKWWWESILPKRKKVGPKFFFAISMCLAMTDQVNWKKINVCFFLPIQISTTNNIGQKKKKFSMNSLIRKRNRETEINLIITPYGYDRLSWQWWWWWCFLISFFSIHFCLFLFHHSFFFIIYDHYILMLLNI